MKMLRYGFALLGIAALALVALTPAPSSYAQAPAATVTQPGNFGSAAPTVVGVTAPGTPVVVATTAQPDYSFSAGNLLGSFINWVWLGFGGLITSVVVLGLLKLAAMLGVQTTQQMNDRLKEAVQNGLNDAASKAQVSVDGKFNVQVKNKVVAQAIEYVKVHQADTIKALGLDPNGGEVVSALRAKAETIIADPALATNPALVTNPKA
jgi:hypothetical protein